MVGCLNLYDLVGDLNFFETLLRSLFKLWTVLASEDARTTVRFTTALQQQGVR